VEVFESEDGVPRMFRQQAQVAQGIARRHEDLLGLAAVHDYFADLYWVKGDDELDRERVLACLAEAHESLDFPFREVGERYRLIKDGTSPVFIRFDDDACRLGEQLRATGPNRGLMRKAQRYMVNAYPHEVKTLQAARALQVLFEGFSVLVAGEYYDQNTGLVATADRHPDPEMLIT
jgi:CRISPR-associated endonuclease/helicase Cas3